MKYNKPPTVLMTKAPMVWAVAMLIICISATSLVLQAGQKQEFEAATVRVSAGAGNMSWRTIIDGGPGSKDPGRARFINVTLQVLMTRAFDIKLYQIKGPEWLGIERYDVTAIVPQNATIEEFRLMLQNLLGDRFHLKYRHESRAVKGYDILVSRGGSKLRVSSKSAIADDSDKVSSAVKRDPQGFPILTHATMLVVFGSPDGTPAGRLAARAQPMSVLSRWLTSQLLCPVVDKTGLTGVYDFRLAFSPEGGMNDPIMSTKGNETGLTEMRSTDLVTAVEQQLGLKLIRKNIDSDLVVVESCDRVPTTN